MGFALVPTSGQPGYFDVATTDGHLPCKATVAGGLALTVQQGGNFKLTLWDGGSLECVVQNESGILEPLVSAGGRYRLSLVTGQFLEVVTAAAVPPFNPATDIPGVLFFSTGDHVVQAGSIVSRWVDQTTHHNDAVPLAGTSPAFGATIFNGEAAISFNAAGGSGAGALLQTPVLPLNGETLLTFYFSVKWTTSPASIVVETNSVLGSDPAATVQQGFGGANSVAAVAAAGFGPTFT